VSYKGYYNRRNETKVNDYLAESLLERCIFSFGIFWRLKSGIKGKLEKSNWLGGWLYIVHAPTDAFLVTSRDCSHIIKKQTYHLPD